MKAGLQDLLRERWMRRRDSGELVWVTKNGDSIPIKNMSDTHLDNAIASCKKYDESAIELEQEYENG